MTEIKPENFISKLQKFLDSTETDYQILESLITERISKENQFVVSFSENQKEIKSDLESFEHEFISLETSIIQPKNELKFRTEKILQVISQIEDKKFVCSTFIKFADFLSEIPKMNFDLIFKTYLNFQNDFGMISDVYMGNQESSDVQSLFQTKLKMAEENIKNLVLKKYLTNEDLFIEEFASVDGSISIFEKIVSFFYQKFLIAKFEENQIEKINKLRSKLNKIYGGIFKEKIQKLTIVFLEKETDKTINQILTNEIAQQKLNDFQEKLKQFDLIKTVQNLILKIMAETSLSNFNKLVSVKNTFIDYFFKDSISKDEFENYFNLNLPVRENIWRVLNLEEKKEYEFYASKFVENFYMVIYELIGFLSGSFEKLNREKVNGIDWILENMSSNIENLDGMIDTCSFLELHARVEFLFYENIKLMNSKM